MYLSSIDIHLFIFGLPAHIYIHPCLFLRDCANGQQSPLQVFTLYTRQSASSLNINIPKQCLDIGDQMHVSYMGLSSVTGMYQQIENTHPYIFPMAQEAKMRGCIEHV